MRFLGVTKIFSGTAVGVSGTVDFDTNAGAAGVVLYVVTTNSAAGNFNFALAARTPDGNVVTLITSPAVAANTTTRVGALPEVPAIANVLAQEPIPGKAQFIYTHNAGTFDIEVFAAFFD